MHKTFTQLFFIMALLLSTQFACAAEEVFKLRMYFGLSLPNGGAVSLADWQHFQQQEIAKTFDGFNVVDSVGYYQGQPERSKIVTLIVQDKDMPKAQALAALYAKQFKQDSVMLVKVPVLEWRFVGANK